MESNGSEFGKVEPIIPGAEAAKNVQRLTRQNGQLREAVKQLEEMLPENLGVCVWCKEAELPPNEYVHEETELVGYDESLGGRVCETCVENADQFVDP